MARKRITLEVDSKGKLHRLDIDGASLTFRKDKGEEIKAACFVTARMILDETATSPQATAELPPGNYCRIIDGKVVCS